MLKYTHKHHPDYPLITKALSSLGVMLQSHNKGIDAEASDHAHKLLAVANSICNIEDIGQEVPNGLVKAGRKFVLEGEIIVKEKAGQGQKSKTLHAPSATVKQFDMKGTLKPYVFLFDDLILLCEQAASRRDQGSERPFVYVKILPLVDAKEIQTDKDPKTIRLVKVGGSSWVLKAKTADEATKWLSYLRQTLANLNGASS